MDTTQASYSGLLNRLRAVWKALSEQPSARASVTAPHTPGTLLEAGDALIVDAVDYRLPRVMTRGLRESAAEAGVYPGAEDPLMEWNAATRMQVLSNCHAAYHRNPLAHAAVNFTTDFVIGNGFNLVCKNPQVEAVLKAFIDNPDNAIRKFERQAVNDLQVDGELVLRFFKDNSGQTVIVPQRPWELQWIQTEAGFFRRPLVYHFERWQSEGDSPTGRTEVVSEEVPAAEIHFVAINDHAYELRGRPELYRVLAWLRADKEWLDERARQNRWRNALLWHVRVTNGTPAALASVIARWRKPPTPGSVYVSGAQEEVRPLVNPVGGAEAGHDGRAIRLMVILGMRLPEYFFGDGSNANLATATRQELPALTKFEAFQQIMIEQVWTPVFRRVLQNAVDAGALGEFLPLTPQPPRPQGARGEENPSTSPSQWRGEKREGVIRAVDAFEVSYEPVTAQDVTALANMLNLAVEKGWASAQTAAERLGFDPSVERERIGAEKA